MTCWACAARERAVKAMTENGNQIGPGVKFRHINRGD